MDERSHIRDFLMHGPGVSRCSHGLRASMLGSRNVTQAGLVFSPAYTSLQRGALSAIRADGATTATREEQQ
jgi:hypothetical protein